MYEESRDAILSRRLAARTLQRLQHQKIENRFTLPEHTCIISTTLTTQRYKVNIVPFNIGEIFSICRVRGHWWLAAIEGLRTLTRTDSLKPGPSDSNYKQCKGKLPGASIHLATSSHPLFRTYFVLPMLRS